jgi:hypothetical protein
MPAIDIQATRTVRAHITRRYVDSSQLEVLVMHGVVYLRGEMTHLRSHPEINLEHEKEVIAHALRGCNGIREVIWEAKLRD